MNFYELYKPLRNHLRKLPIGESLYVIWSYDQLLAYNKPLPGDIEFSYKFITALNKLSMVSPWELETLAREVIINANSSGNKTFKQLSYFADGINKLKNLENEMAKIYINTDNVLSEFNRIAHRQFPWQMDRPNMISLIRYFKIFSYPGIDEIVKNKTGIEVDNFYILSTALFGVYLNNFALNDPPNIQIPELNQEMLDMFLAMFSMQIETLRSKLIDEQELNDKFVYTYNSLRGHPIIKTDYLGKKRLLCPLPELLFWRFTDGLYFELSSEKTFDNLYGSSFEKYVGDVAYKAKTNSNIIITPEEEYKVGKNLKHSSDWIMSDKKATLFIECKTKRMKVAAKAELQTNEVLGRELDKAAEFVVQVYKTIYDYKQGRYSGLKYDENKKIFPLIVTLGEWYLFGEVIPNEILGRVSKRMQDLSIPISLLEEAPYTFCSVNDFEILCQVIQKIGIDTVMTQKTESPAKKLWTLGQFLAEEFTEEYKSTKFLFEDELKGRFADSLTR